MVHRLSFHDSVCIIVAHADDEVLGCGGLISLLADEGCKINLLVLGDGETSRTSASPVVHDEQVKQREVQCRDSASILGISSCEFAKLPDNQLDAQSLLSVVHLVEKFIVKHNPSLVITHFNGDLNVDHRVVSQSCLVACRPKHCSSVNELIFFETVSSTEWGFGKLGTFNPNLFIEIEKAFDRKLQALRCYTHEICQPPHPRSERNIEALAILRGSQSGLFLAEAFEIAFIRT